MSQRAFSGDSSALSASRVRVPETGSGDLSSDPPGAAKKAVFLTAGAAGMYCGSCMHDNAIARALRRRGVDCLLQPVYTPIRADGPSIASEQVFFGGIQVYLLQHLPWIRWVPRPLRRVLDWPPLIRMATRRAGATDPAKLGEMAVSMLQGKAGRQRDEVTRLVDWLVSEDADAVVFSNLLIGGALPEIRRRLPRTRITVILQGDDIFLDHLPDDARIKCIELCQQLIGSADRLVVNSRFYAEKMGAVFSVSPERFEVTPLSIDTQPFIDCPPRRTDESSAGEPARGGEFRLGYFARVAPEKGLHRIVEAFVKLAERPENGDLTLHVAGWLGEANRSYLEAQQQIIRSAGLADRFVYHGSPDLQGKVAFLSSLDLLSVPTDYQEPKGLFVLEAMAAGVPVIQPAHGAFPELIEATEGGLVITPGDVEELAAAIQRLKDDPELRQSLGATGRDRVLGNHSIEKAAERFHRIIF